MGKLRTLFPILVSFLSIVSLQIVSPSALAQTSSRIEKAGPLTQGQVSESLSVTGVDRAQLQLSATGAGVGVLVIDDFSSAHHGLPHGESVAALIEEAAPGASVWLCKIDFSHASLADFTGCLQDISSGRLSVQIVNMSFSMGQDFYSSQCGADLNEFGQAIHNLANKGVIFVAAADNQGDKDGLRFPACQEDVISVGATYGFSGGKMDFVSGDFSCSDTAKLDSITCYSNVAPYLSVLAPGSTRSASGRLEFGGTSASAPIVSGVIALMLSQDPSLRRSRIMQILSQTGQAVYDENLKTSFPRVDAFGALSALGASASFAAAPAVTVPPSHLSPQGLLSFDLDQNGHIDDHEFFQALDQWVQGKLSNSLFYDLIDAWTGQVAVQSVETRSARSAPLQVQRDEHSLLFSAGNDADRVQLFIYDTNGQPLYHGQSSGRALRWNLSTSTGRRIANGVYIYTFVEEINGRLIRETGKVSIMR